jgi:hypothetical protein
MTRHPGRRHWINVVAVAALFVAGRASAGIVGPLANFDIVNDTGQPAYGFEIEIDDPSFDHTKLTSIFGYDRVFSFVSQDPGAVVRFGKPVITDMPGVGVRITFGGTVGAGAITTPTGVFTTPGESCWPGANPNWKDNPCDHYGVSTLGQPASTTYRWLIESAPGSGTLVGKQVGIPSVAFVYTPPVPNPNPILPPLAPAAVNIQMRAVAPNPEQPENVDLWGEPFWVKTLSTKVPHDIDLGNLLRGDPDQEAAEVETEWSIFQKPPAGVVDPVKEVLEKDLDLADADHAVIRRYEFYKYAGSFNVDGSGEVLCDGQEVPGHRCDTPFGDPGSGINDLGDFVGAQMAGVNLDVVVECSDGIDNDGDGYLDFPDDTGCTSASDVSEQVPVSPGYMECDDGFDNDGDHLVDMADPGCPTPFSSPENPSCNDNLDNDNDGLTDQADPDCSTVWPYHEETANWKCGYGGELVLPLGFLLWLRNRRRRTAA